MKFKTLVFLWAVIGPSLQLFSQDNGGSVQRSGGYKWWDPAGNSFPVLEGQAWPKEVKSPYDRFPGRAQSTLNPNVWNISHSSAGLYLKFKTDASNIVVRYVVQNKGNFAMSHMPATGVSGIDLYAIDHNGSWSWAPGTFSFGDTIEYRFSNIEADHEFTGRDCEYRLFLPLYNAVSWMQIGVPENKRFTAMPLQPEKPIVVYGTSITQGACASRPGMAWTAILERTLDRPVINLGFSGSGRLEKPVIDLMTEIDARLYILDCLPNLTAGAGFTGKEVAYRIRAAIRGLQERRPSIPILLVEHSSGNTTRIIDTARYAEFGKVNQVLQEVITQLKAEGVKNIYVLTNKAIDFDIDATVDGLHPNDIGMKKYADAYEKIIRLILHEPEGRYTTSMPVVQSRDGYYDWRERHAEVLALNKATPPVNVILANSIVHYWGGKPQAPISRGADSWDKYLEPLGVRNLGFGWDKIENVLWRVYHEELDGYTARHVVIMIGTNNLTANTDEEILEGLKILVQAVKQRQPEADVLLSGLLPRRNMEERIVGLNREIAKLAGAFPVRYIEPGKVLLAGRGKIDESLFGDGLHPNAAGYERLGKVLAQLLSGSL